MAIRKLLLGAAMLALAVSAQQTNRPDEPPRGTYLLGPDDVITIRVMDAEEFSDKPVRIGSSGHITLPMVGRLQASGRTAEDLEKEITAKLKTYIRNPEVSVSVMEQKSQPVSVFGAVNTPGVFQLQGRKTLVEMLAMAGGTRPEAGYSVRITREKEWGPIPLPNATSDASGQFSVAEVDLKKITEAKNPAENILIMPKDVITVPRGEMVYVIGDVKRSGQFVLSEKAHMSVLQALSMAAGLEKTASPSNAKILRASNAPDNKRMEIPVDLKKVMQGKEQDVPMEPEDILLVPGSKTKAALVRSLEAALQIGSGMAIYRGY